MGWFWVTVPELYPVPLPHEPAFCRSLCRKGEGLDVLRKYKSFLI
jgi:hypothetical protein